jgi:hypothetical protein
MVADGREVVVIASGVVKFARMRAPSPDDVVPLPTAKQPEAGMHAIELRLSASEGMVRLTHVLPPSVVAISVGVAVWPLPTAVHWVDDRQETAETSGTPLGMVAMVHDAPPSEEVRTSPELTGDPPTATQSRIEVQVTPDRPVTPLGRVAILHADPPSEVNTAESVGPSSPTATQCDVDAQDTPWYPLTAAATGCGVQVIPPLVDAMIGSTAL